MPLTLSTIVNPMAGVFLLCFFFTESRLNNHMDDKDICIGFHVISKDPLASFTMPMKLCLLSVLLSLKVWGRVYLAGSQITKKRLQSWLGVYIAILQNLQTGLTNSCQ